MGGIADAIGDVWNGIVDTVSEAVGGVWEGIKELGDAVWKDIGYPLVEWVMSVFGVTDQDIITVHVSDQLMAGTGKNGAQELLKKVMLNHARFDHGIMDQILLNTTKVKGHYNNYYNNGVNSYYNGLPTSSLKATVMPIELMTTLINQKYGITATILEIEAKVPTKLEYVYGYLYMQYSTDFSASTNTLVYSGYAWQVGNIEYDYTMNKYVVRLSREEITTVTAQDGTVTTTTTVVTSSLLSPAYEPKQYYVARFAPVDDINAYQYGWYLIGSGVYPMIDNVSKYYTTPLEILPIVEIRNNGVNINSNKTTEKYTDTVSILKTIGIDLDELTDGICQVTDTRTQASVDAVTDAYVYFGINAKDTDPTVSKLLYNCLSFAYEQQDLYVTATETTGVANSYTITFIEGNYNVAISWASQSRDMVAGTIGAVGAYSHSIVGKDLIVNKQATETEYVSYRFNSVGSVTVVKRGGMAGTTAAGLSDDQFVIPLSKFMLEKMTPLEQVTVFGKSLRLAVYSAEITHLEWYETEAFGTFLQIVIIVIIIIITVVTLGSGTAGATAAGSSAMAAAGAAAGTAAAGASALMTLAINFAIGMAATMALGAILRSNAPDWVKAIAAVAYVVVMVYFTGGGDLSQITTADGWAAVSTNWATTVGVVASAGNTYVGVEQEELRKDYNAFTSRYEEATKKIEDATKLNLPDLGIDPVWLAQSNLAFSMPATEKPYMPTTYSPSMSIYMSRDVQYNWDAMKSIDLLKSNYLVTPMIGIRTI